MVYILIALAVVVVAAVVMLFLRRRKPINTNRFQEGWRDLQKLLRDKTTWPQAITSADKLLDEALKKRRFGGKTMGERMVKAQRIFSDNDGVWFGHKLRSKIEAEPEMKLKEDDVKDALIGIRQGLKDLGALPDGKKESDNDK